MYSQQSRTRLIDSIEGIRAHDHPCLIYEACAERQAVVVPFVRVGLERGERCLYFATRSGVETLLADLAAAGIDAADAVKQRRLFIPDIPGIYRQDEPFDPDRVFEFLHQAVDDAKKEGHTGFRVIGEMPWTLQGLTGPERLIEYEARLNEFLLTHDVPILCLYDLSRFSTTTILDVIRTHPKVFFANALLRSYSYLPPSEFLSPDRAYLELEHLLNGMQANQQLLDRLHEENTLLNSIFANTTDAIYVKNLEGRYLMVNQAGAAFLGQSVTQVLGRSDSELLPPQSAAILQERDRTAMLSSTPLTTEEVISIGGVTRTYLSTKGPYRDTRGNVIGIFGISRNITERKQNEARLNEHAMALEAEVAERQQAQEELAVKQLQLETFNQTLEQRIGDAVAELRDKDQLMISQSRHAAMGEMISNIAHQWRQPLNTLGLLAQELQITYRAGELSREFVEANVKKILEVIRHMSRTIDDFRSFLRADSEKEEFKAHEVLKRTLSLLEAGLAAQKIRVEIEVTGDPVINGYPSEFAHVLLNILNNAQDAFATGKVAAPVILIRLFREDGRTVVTVADNAGGIPDENLEKIFEPYFTTKGPEKGTGIGLFMCKIIIEKKMNGVISMHNVADGAEFRIEL